MRILLVDDRPSQLVAHQAILSELGEVVTATSGADALRLLLKEEFAVILLDVNMPGMDGFETAVLVRRRKSCKDVPIIFLTAYADELQAAHGYSLGAVDYVLTPVIPDVLRAKVRVFVELYLKTAKIRRQAERLRERAAQLGRLTSQLIRVEERERARLSKILHDHVQQLLAAARMRVQLAQEQAGDRDLAKMLDEVDELIGQSITAARSLSIELHPPVLDAGLRPSLDWLARHMEKSCRLTVEVKGEPSRELTMEQRVLLFDAVRELLLNVVKHAGVDRARVLLEEPDLRTLTIAVEDQGLGFDAEKIGDVETLLEHSGLRNIRAKLTAFHGDLTAVSDPGKGTRITIRIPIHAQPAQAHPVTEGQERDVALSTSGEPIRVLLADDHEILRKGLRSLLQRHPDIEVVGEAADGEEAVQLARRLGPHVVIMDLSMPRLGGIEATRAIVGESPWIRVIGLSMRDGEDTAAAMSRAGAFAHLAKGGPPESLISMIRQSMKETGGRTPAKL